MEALLLLALIAAIYLGSCAAHPYRACGACGRSKESHSTMFKGAFGACRSCAGRGHTVRLGARLLGKS
ncbi:hypothetical protein [Nonomuraea sp. SBT364]|uniref:hypothetical protein n=1 Tax=Nonomuraea sp. SBT364 TaxID=1580530 RepID=UPI00066BBCA2|nr:hypothetical protein [Nonomuraea sp. SBT364]